MRLLPALVALVALLAVAAAPTDPLAPQQWHLSHVGVPTAWQQAGRGGDVVVAVVDTGVDLRHPDLQGRLVPGNDLVQPGTPPEDGVGHGTMVAGLIAAVADNGIGGAGAAPQARIMPVRVLDDRGDGDSRRVARGIRWAAANGAAVINLSLAEVRGLTSGVLGLVDREVQDAIREAAEAGVVVVVAAGNDGSSPPYDRNLPALVVGATERSDRVWTRSNVDARTLLAPGVDMVSTWRRSEYRMADGTSFATPVVSAGAALLLAGGADAAGVRERLVRTAVPVGAGAGRLDLAAATRPQPAATAPARSPSPAPASSAPRSPGTGPTASPAPRTPSASEPPGGPQPQQGGGAPPGPVDATPGDGSAPGPATPGPGEASPWAGDPQVRPLAGSDGNAGAPPPADVIEAPVTAGDPWGADVRPLPAELPTAAPAADGGAGAATRSEDDGRHRIPAAAWVAALLVLTNVAGLGGWFAARQQARDLR